MKPEDKKTFLISAGMIILLSLISFFRIKNFNETDISLNLPKIENTSPQPDFLNILQHGGEDSFLTETEKAPQKELKYTRKNIENQLSFDYPSSWFVPNTTGESVENIELYFLAYSQNIYAPTVLMVFKTPFADFENITKIIKESLDDDGAEDVVIEESKDHLRATYSIDGQNVISEFKALLFNDHSFVLSFTFFDGQKPEESIVEYVKSSFKKIY